MLIHQEFNLAEDLTIAQNIFLGHEKKRGWLLDDAAMRARARPRRWSRWGCSVEPATRGAPADRRRKADGRDRQGAGAQRAAADHGRAHRHPDPGETEQLFELIARLRAEGVTILYISHKLDEVERISDRVTVMRDGRFVHARPPPTLTGTRWPA